MVILLVSLGLGFLVLRIWSRRIGRADTEPADRVHRIRRLVLVASLVLGPVVGLGIWETAREAGVVSGPVRAGLWVLCGVLVLSALLVPGLAVRPAYQALRGVDESAVGFAGRSLRSLALVVPVAVFLIALRVAEHLDAGPWVLVGILLLFLVGAPLLTPHLLRLALTTTEADPEVRRLVDRVCEQAGVRARDVRIIRTTHDPTVNAMVAGRSHVFLTDRLVSELEPDELEAVVAHEVSHLRRHHVAKQIGAMLLLYAVVLAVVLTAALLHTHLTQPLRLFIAVVVVVLLVSTPFVARGALGIRFEYQADADAAAATSPAALRSALEKLTAHNLMRRHTGRVWNLMSRHPGMDQRIDRLSAGSGA